MHIAYLKEAHQVQFTDTQHAGIILYAMCHPDCTHSAHSFNKLRIKLTPAITLTLLTPFFNKLPLPW